MHYTLHLAKVYDSLYSLVLINVFFLVAVQEIRPDSGSVKVNLIIHPDLPLRTIIAIRVFRFDSFLVDPKI